MRVALGTIEVDDETRRKIRALKGGKGDATRSEVKDYVIGKVKDDVLPNVEDGDGSGGKGTGQKLDEPVQEELPEPTSGGPSSYSGGATTSTAAGGTAPSTGDLGSAGIPGGTTSGGTSGTSGGGGTTG